MYVSRLIVIFLLWLPVSAAAQGFAGLGGTGEGFAMPEPGVALHFPQDRGAHPDFRIEWWYVTANLASADGREFGAQWTLFRVALAPGAAPGEAEGWGSSQVWFGHAATTTPTAHFAAERRARGGIGQADVAALPFAATIDDWSLLETATGYDMTAAGGDFAYDLTLTAQGPLVLHGDAGYSAKSSEGTASYYYSEPFLRASGVLHLPEGDVAVNGQAWLDHEWSSRPLTGDQTGWDWFALHLDNGARLMGFQVRGAVPFVAATWIEADGQARTLAPGDFNATPLVWHEVAGVRVPIRWHVNVPSQAVDVRLEAVNPDAWMPLSIPYWEGPVRVSGSHAGRGYLEMTGYD